MVPAGVSVVAALTSGSGFRAMTASSFASVSVDPPLVVVSLDAVSQTREAVVGAGHFAVSLLERSQEFIADRFAGRAPAVDAGWSGVPHRVGRAGAPVVAGAVAWFECDVEQVQRAGDHDLVVGLVTACGVGPGEPLVHWSRSFWRLA